MSTDAANTPCMTEEEARAAVRDLLGNGSSASSMNYGTHYSVLGYREGWDLGDKIHGGSGIGSWDAAVKNFEENLREWEADEPTERQMRGEA